MTVVNCRRVRAKRTVERLDMLDPGDRLLLEIGPPPRVRYRPEWPAEVARLEVLWTIHREALLEASPPTLRPWALWMFDVPASVRTPGPIQDALIAAGTITPGEAALMATMGTSSR